MYLLNNATTPITGDPVDWNAASAPSNGAFASIFLGGSGLVVGNKVRIEAMPAGNQNWHLIKELEIGESYVENIYLAAWKIRAVLVDAPAGTNITLEIG